MVTRSEIVQVLNDLVVWGNELVTRTNFLLQAERLDPPPKLICYLGANVHRALKAIQILEPHHLDDQIDPIARNITEAALDVEYLSVTTKRGDVELTPEQKTTLFNSSFLHNRDRLMGLSFMKNAKVEYTAQEQAVFERLEKEREAIKVPSQGHFWHGTTQANVVAELQEALKDNTVAVTMIQSMYDAYIYLSQQTHTGPNYTDTFAPMSFAGRAEISGTTDFDPTLVFGLSISAVVLARWALSTDADAIFDRRDALQKRLSK